MASKKLQIEYFEQHGYADKWTLLWSAKRFGKMKSTLIMKSSHLSRWNGSPPAEYPCLAKSREVYAGGGYYIVVDYVYRSDAKGLL